MKSTRMPKEIIEKLLNDSNLSPEETQFIIALLSEFENTKEYVLPILSNTEDHIISSAALFVGDVLIELVKDVELTQRTCTKDFLIIFFRIISSIQHNYLLSTVYIRLIYALVRIHASFSEKRTLYVILVGQIMSPNCTTRLFALDSWRAIDRVDPRHISSRCLFLINICGRLSQATPHYEWLHAFTLSQLNRLSPQQKEALSEFTHASLVLQDNDFSRTSLCRIMNCLNGYKLVPENARDMTSLLRDNIVLSANLERTLDLIGHGVGIVGQSPCPEDRNGLVVLLLDCAGLLLSKGRTLDSHFLEKLVNIGREMSNDESVALSLVDFVSYCPKLQVTELVRTVTLALSVVRNSVNKFHVMFLYSSLSRLMSWLPEKYVIELGRVMNEGLGDFIHFLLPEMDCSFTTGDMDVVI